MTGSDIARCWRSIADDWDFSKQAVGIYSSPIKIDKFMYRGRRALPSLPVLPPLASLPSATIQ